MKNNKLYQKAKKIVLKENNASISFLQRKLMVGYNTAKIIIKQFEDDKIISRPNKNYIRVVLSTNEHYKKTQ